MRPQWGQTWRLRRTVPMKLPTRRLFRLLRLRVCYGFAHWHTASQIRTLAWCGTKRSISTIRRPACSIALSEHFVITRTACKDVSCRPSSLSSFGSMPATKGRLLPSAQIENQVIPRKTRKIPYAARTGAERLPCLFASFLRREVLVPASLAWICVEQ